MSVCMSCLGRVLTFIMLQMYVAFVVFVVFVV